MARWYLLIFACVLSQVAHATAASSDLVWVPGGTFQHPKSPYRERAVVVAGFYLGRYEVTQQQWAAVMGSNPSHFQGDDRPVEMVSWYDSIEYCNRRSVQEGLEPYYTIDRGTADPNNRNENDELKWTVTTNPGANGYRLPTEIEWEYAASGGAASEGFVYSGANELERVGWYWRNSGQEPLDGLWNWPLVEANQSSTHPVGAKAPNELGLYDMSGNVREWCWDWYAEANGEAGPPAAPPASGAARVWKGGGWVGGDFCCEPSFRAHHEPHSMGFDQGLRVCRSGPEPAPTREAEQSEEPDTAPAPTAKSDRERPTHSP